MASSSASASSVSPAVGSTTATTPGPDNTREITVGVEWEFLVAYRPSPPKEGSYFSDPMDPAAVAAAEAARPGAVVIRPALYVASSARESINTTEKAIFENVRAGLKKILGDAVVVMTEDEAEDDDIEPDEIWRSQGGFTIKEDGSLTSAGLPRVYQFLGVEVTTPILSGANGAALSRRVADVTRALKTQNRAAANDTCGLHVHVGMKGGWDLVTLKKLATLLFLISPRLCLLSAPSRADPTATAGKWCQPLTRFSRLGANYYSASAGLARLRLTSDQIAEFTPQFVAFIGDAMAPLRPAASGPSASPLSGLSDLEGKIRLIWLAKNQRQLAEILSPGVSTGGIGIKFGHLKNMPGREEVAAGSWRDESELTGKNTIEFRQWAGTLDPHVAGAWANLCKQFVAASAAWTAEEFRGVVAALVKPMEEMDVWAVLDQIPGIRTTADMEESLRCLKQHVKDN